jgi:hypothetical protein
MWLALYFCQHFQKDDNDRKYSRKKRENLMAAFYAKNLSCAGVRLVSLTTTSERPHRSEVFQEEKGESDGGTFSTSHSSSYAPRKAARQEKHSSMEDENALIEKAQKAW